MDDIPSDFLASGSLDSEIRRLRRDLIGRQIGVYQITALVGVGGMGEVYRARDLDRPAEEVMRATRFLTAHLKLRPAATNRQNDEADEPTNLTNLPGGNSMKIRLIVVIAAFCAGLVAHPALTAQTSGRRVIQPKQFPYLGLPFSPAIVVGDTMFLSGVLGRDPATTKLVSGGIEAETRQALNNIREVLRADGMDFGNVVTTTAYIVDFKEFDGFNKVYREFFPKDPPARATVGVAALNQGGRVELQMIAVRAGR